MPFKATCFAFVFLAAAALVWASEAEELRDKAHSMQQQAKEMAKNGNTEEAEYLERKALNLLEEAERLEDHDPDRREAEARELRGVLEKLRREAERVESRLRELQERHPDHREEMVHRIEHMRIAVDHLNRAGMHEVAEQIARRAEAAERELHRHRPHPEIGDMMHEVMKQVGELRHEVERLRDEVAELKDKE